MTFFERYFERLDGDDRLSALELVAENLEFSIQWAANSGRKSSQFLGGLESSGASPKRATRRVGPTTSCGAAPTATSSSRSARPATTTAASTSAPSSRSHKLDEDGA